jgi:hypothetical protein
MQRTKRDREAFNLTLNEYHLEMLDAILSALSIDPKAKVGQPDSNPLLNRLDHIRRIFVRSRKSGPPEYAEKAILDAVLTFGLIKLSTALNDDNIIPSETPHFTGDIIEDPPTINEDTLPKSWLIQGHYEGLLRSAIAQARLNTVINATSPTDSNDQD